MFPEKPNESSFWEHPLLSVRGVTIILLVLLSFLLGRYLFPADVSVLDVLSEGAEPAKELKLQEPVKTEAAAQKTSAETPAPTEAKETTSTTGAAVAESAPNATSTTDTKAAPETKEEATNEPVIDTGYSQVQLVLTGIRFDWREEDNYGKLEEISYTITNGEKGTIKPTKLVLFMEGYENPREQDVELSSALLNIKSGATFEAKSPLSVAYAPQAVGSLDDVELRLELKDGNDELIASGKKAFKLNK